MSEGGKEVLFQSAGGIASLLRLDEVMQEIASYIKEKPDRRYEIIVGSDSSATSERPVAIVTALTVRRVGNGGRYFYARSEPKMYHDVRGRIYDETMRSITLAQELRGRLSDILGEEIFWQDQIHIDVGERGLTRTMVDEVVGMVKGFNFTAIIKPDSFAASSVADRHT